MNRRNGYLSIHSTIKYCEIILPKHLVNALRPRYGVPEFLFNHDSQDPSKLI